MTLFQDIDSGNNMKNAPNYNELFKKLMVMDNMENFSEFHTEYGWVVQRSYYFSTLLELPSTGNKFNDFIIFDFTNLDTQGTVFISSGEGELLDCLTYEKSLNEVIEQYWNKKIVFEYYGKPKIHNYKLSKKNTEYLLGNPHSLDFHELVSRYSSLRDCVLNNLKYLDSKDVVMKQKFAHSVVHRVPLFYKNEGGGYVLRSHQVSHGIALDTVNVSIPAVPFGQIISGKRELGSYDLMVGKGKDFNEAYKNLADKIICTYGVKFDKWKGFPSNE